ncbi:MAG: ShlB/FhaC/HecB family hemolysin secretion/activation protein [Cyanobacteria bacterium P01_F01_bin.143]
MFRLKFIFTNIFWFFSFYLLSIANLAQAQNAPSPPPGISPLPSQPEPVEPEPLPSLEEILPELQETTPGVSPNIIEDIPNKVFIKKFEIIGSTVFTPEELASVLAPYTMRRISFAELLEAQQAINRLYITNGYITSGTFIPPQQLQDGIVAIEVVEGTVEAINITGLTRLNSGYVRDRLEIATNAPLNREKLLNALQLLQLDPLIENLAAELTAGTRPASSILEINLQEADPFDLTLSVDNYRAPSVGSDRRQVKLVHRNLLGFGDRINLAYANTDGSNSLSDLNYRIPLNPQNGTLDFRFSYTDNEIIEEPFDRFNIESENFNYELTYRQPLLQKPTEDLALGLTFSRYDSKTTLDGQRFQLSRGTESDGETHISAIRFFQEYTNRNAQQVFALRSQFSLGVNLFDATINDNDVPDSKFLAWRGQAQYLSLLSDELTLLLRSDFQLADRPLVAVEQFSLGGALSVRGYRQDLLLGDNGLFNSAELRATILRIPQWETIIQLTPFVDFGKVWNLDNVVLDKNTLVSTGIGLRLQVSDYLAARLDWGIPLVDLEVDGDSLQEDGVYFSLELQPF